MSDNLVKRLQENGDFLRHVEAQTARIAELEAVVKEIISQIDQSGSGGLRFFARDYCIQRARKVLGER